MFNRVFAFVVMIGLLVAGVVASPKSHASGIARRCADGSFSDTCVMLKSQARPTPKMVMEASPPPQAQKTGTKQRGGRNTRFAPSEVERVNRLYRERAKH
jgi:hypothetical protein